MTPYDFKLHSGAGTAEPVFAAQDLYPSALDAALDSLKARQTWEAANVTGTAAQATYVVAANEWAASHPKGDYVDLPAWLHGLGVGTRSETAAVNACTAKSRAALIAYRNAQIAGAISAKPRFIEAWLAADRQSIDAWKVLDEALATREELTKYIVVPDRSSVVGRGHWRHSSALAGRMSLHADYQRDDMRTIVLVAPRDLVKALAK